MKFLLLRFSAIGDIAWTSLAVRCLKKQFPDATLHFCTKSQYKNMVQYNPDIDKVICLEKNQKIGTLITELQAENYDYVVDFHNNLRTTYIKFWLGKKSFTSKKYSWARWWLVQTKQNFVPHTHVAQWHVETLAPLGVIDDGGKLAYFLHEKKDKINLKTLPKKHQNGYVAIVIGATEWTKKLPLEKLIELCQKINKPIILLGGKEEIPLSEEVKVFFDNVNSANSGKSDNLQAVHIYNACGKYTLNQSVYLGKEALCIFGQDTGLTHILASFDKKIFGIFGGTVPQHCYPYTPNREILEVKDLDCRPCSRSGRKSCPKGHFKCMKDMDFSKMEIDI